VRVILGLADVPRPEHSADALAAAICAAYTDARCTDAH
jgi:Holliday junction resolvasome RuvABC endonuclease subunit